MVGLLHTRNLPVPRVLTSNHPLASMLQELPIARVVGHYKSQWLYYSTSDNNSRFVGNALQ